MQKKFSQFILILILLIAVVSFKMTDNNGEISPYSSRNWWDIKEVKDYTVSDVLDLMNEPRPSHYLKKIDADSAKMGEEMVKFGKLSDGSNSRVSKYFVCTDCHNLQLETDDPSDESPERVLKFSKKNKIPFLPASTFYGMYNKEHWYNGDYAKKYGELVAPTRDTLFNAIQLCATQCSQGREMDDWEIRTVMHYFKSLELKISDLVFTSEEYQRFSAGVNAGMNKKLTAELKTKYNQINDAHFGTSEIPKIEGYEPKLENGKYIYNGGCLHCHAVGRNITNFDLDDSQLTHKFLLAKKHKYNSYSISHITRYGTYAISGRRQYMPQYSFEDMSDEQMLDLMYYIETRANE